MSVAVSIPSITANKVASSVRIQLSRDDYALRTGLLTLICFLFSENNGSWFINPCFRETNEKSSSYNDPT